MTLMLVVVAFVVVVVVLALALVGEEENRGFGVLENSPLLERVGNRNLLWMGDGDGDGDDDGDDVVVGLVVVVVVVVVVLNDEFVLPKLLLLLGVVR